MKKIMILLCMVSGICFSQTDLDKAKAYYFQAEEQLAQGNSEKTLEYLNQSVSLIGDTNGSIEALRAKAYYKAENFDKAREALSKFYQYSDSAPKDLLNEMAALMVNIDEKKREISAADNLEKVTNRYISAVGNENEINKIKNIVFTGRVESYAIKDAIISYTIIIDNSNNYLEMLKVNDNLISKKVFSDNEGYKLMNKKKTLLNDNEIESFFNYFSHIIPELTAENIKYDGITEYNNESFNVLRFGNNVRAFYDIKSGLKRRTHTQLLSEDNQSYEIFTKYDKYKSFKGLFLPSVMTQKMSTNDLESKIYIESIVINEDLNKNIFD